jgi:nicotinamidase-related amidase
VASARVELTVRSATEHGYHVVLFTDAMVMTAHRHGLR